MRRGPDKWQCATCEVFHDSEVISCFYCEPSEPSSEVKFHEKPDYIDLEQPPVFDSNSFVPLPFRFEDAKTALQAAESALANIGTKFLFETMSSYDKRIADAQRAVDEARAQVALLGSMPQVKVIGYEVISVPNEDYICPICLLVARDAVAHTCGKLFCATCWKEWSAHGRGCSCCTEQGEVFPALRDRKFISNLMMKCVACKFELRIGDYEKHHTTDCNQRRVLCVQCRQEATPASMPKHLTKECVHRSVKCSACQEVLHFVDLKDHRASSCVQRFVPCEDCLEKVRFCELVSHKSRTCAARSIVCPECPQTTTPRDLATHLVSTCLNRPLPCSLCGTLVKKTDMFNHLKTSIEVHLAGLMQQVSQLQLQVTVLQTENQELRAIAQARPVTHSSHPRCFLTFVDPQLGSRECTLCEIEGTGFFHCQCAADLNFCRSCLRSV